MTALIFQWQFALSTVNCVQCNDCWHQMSPGQNWILQWIANKQHSVNVRTYVRTYVDKDIRYTHSATSITSVCTEQTRLLSRQYPYCIKCRIRNDSLCPNHQNVYCTVLAKPATKIYHRHVADSPAELARSSHDMKGCTVSSRWQKYVVHILRKKLW